MEAHALLPVQPESDIAVEPVVTDTPGTRGNGHLLVEDFKDAFRGSVSMR